MNSGKMIIGFFVFLLAAVFIFTAGCTGTIPASSVNSVISTTPPVTATTVPAATPDIVGMWTGTMTGHTSLEGFRETDRPKFNITAQKGSAFTGDKEYMRADGKMYYENLSGVISHDGKIFMADHDAGIISGEFIGPDEIELRYLQDGTDAKAFIIRLTRTTV